jgi:hypothetical protein
MILVHCTAGVSRSATIVMAYLMHAHRLTLKQAFVHVKLRRTAVRSGHPSAATALHSCLSLIPRHSLVRRPNGGFMEQLWKYERDLHGSSSVTEFQLVRRAGPRCLCHLHTDVR